MAKMGSECDILFLSYAEPVAEENFQRLLARFPRAKRLHGVTGVDRANKLTAEVVDTDYYFLVDADNQIKKDFDFNNVDVPEKPHIIKVWSCENAVNGLVYGYGGVKLCCRSAIRTLTSDKLDVFGTGIGQLIFDRKVASITYFNSNAFEAWKAGFRECSKLQAGSGIEMLSDKVAAKINIWTTKGGDKPNGKWAIRGAIDGVSYAKENEVNFVALKKIDDPKWLISEFKKRYVK